MTVITEKRKNDHLSFLSGSTAWVVLQAGEVQSDNRSLTVLSQQRSESGLLGQLEYVWQSTREEQLHREIALGFEVPLSLQSNITSKLHLCWVKLHETGQRTTEKRAITQKILETTQASAMFWFQPVSMESSNECPRNSVETLERLYLENINSLTLGESLL